jgi:hypothetical protein
MGGVRHFSFSTYDFVTHHNFIGVENVEIDTFLASVIMVESVRAQKVTATA